jgi:hypothetical protein
MFCTLKKNYTLKIIFIYSTFQGIFPNGTRSYSAGARETFRNCADIQIRRNTASLLPYTPTTIEDTPALYRIYHDTPVVFTCNVK